MTNLPVVRVSHFPFANIPMQCVFGRIIRHPSLVFVYDPCPQWFHICCSTIQAIRAFCPFPIKDTFVSVLPSPCSMHTVPHRWPWITSACCTILRKEKLVTFECMECRQHSTHTFGTQSPALHGHDIMKEDAAMLANGLETLCMDSACGQYCMSYELHVCSKHHTSVSNVQHTGVGHLCDFMGC